MCGEKMLGLLIGAVALKELGCFDADKGFDLQIEPIDLGFNVNDIFGEDDLEIGSKNLKIEDENK